MPTAASETPTPPAAVQATPLRPRLSDLSAYEGVARPGTDLATVRDYHQRTKHRLNGYAAGPQTLDWEAQPDPFRRYAGAPLQPLTLAADRHLRPWATLFDRDVTAEPVSRETIGVLLELSFALAAWKQMGPDRWAVRCNPSSGNLHPTEAYVLTCGVSGLDDGVHHYAPHEHALETRCRFGPLGPFATEGSTVEPAAPARAWVALSSIHWREAWKYGERAFRYCQLDAGHALGALRYAAAVLGWGLRVQPVAADELSALLGLDRDADFGSAEREDPELLIELCTDGATRPVTGPATGPTATGHPWSDTLANLAAAARDGRWQGTANRLDLRPMYRWPVIDAVARATRPVGEGEIVRDPACHVACPRREPACGPLESAALNLLPPRPPLPGLLWAKPAVNVIRSRRSAQRFDRRASQSVESFWRMVSALQPVDGLPWDAWPHVPRVHPVLFVHRVEGLSPGAYALPRTQQALVGLQVALSPDLLWKAVPGAPDDLPLYLLAENPALSGTLRTLCCHQALGSDATFAVAFLAEFDGVLAGASGAAPWRYRTLLQEAGLLGHVLYLHAEAEGLRGTGIGCFFDDGLHELLGLRDSRFQSVYHFTVGMPVADTRIASEPPYVHLPADRQAPLEPAGAPPHEP